MAPQSIRWLTPSTIVLLLLLCTIRAFGQGGAGFDLTLIDVEGNKTVLGTLPPSTYAPRISPDGKSIAFETRDPNSPDGARLWTADLSNIAGRKPLPVVAGPINWAPMWTPMVSDWCSLYRAIVRTQSIGGVPTAPVKPSI